MQSREQSKAVPSRPRENSLIARGTPKEETSRGTKTHKGNPSSLGQTRTTNAKRVRVYSYRLRKREVLSVFKACPICQCLNSLIAGWASTCNAGEAPSQHKTWRRFIVGKLVSRKTVAGPPWRWCNGIRAHRMGSSSAAVWPVAQLRQFSSDS